MGGDEVVLQCWSQDPAIASWMQAQGFASANDAFQWWISQMADWVRAQNKSITVLYWQDVFDAGMRDPKAIYQVWRDDATLQKVSQAGMQSLLSAGWYFDQPLNWKQFYSNEPCPDWDCSGVLGGAACAWGEYVNSNNIIQTIFPRLLAAAERLWSSKSVSDVANAQSRIQQKICQLNQQRNIASGPVAPSHC